MEEERNKPYKFEMFGKLFNFFFSFLLGTNVYKTSKHKLFRCIFEDKMDKQKRSHTNLIDFNGFLCKTNELEI